MKKIFNSKITNILIIVINVLFVFGLFMAEWQYIRTTRASTVESNKEMYLNTNTSLGSITNNYLLGESHLCRSWSNYLKKNTMSIDDAIKFVGDSIIDDDVMAHIVYKDTFKGYSTKPKKNTTDYMVDYSSLSDDVFTATGEGVKISSSFINPINASRSIAFYGEIELVDPDDSTQKKDAYLLRVVLLSNLSKKWVFPGGSFSHLEVAIIDKSGNYVTYDNSFTNSNFFEFYRSYNNPTPAALDDLKTEVNSSSGLFKMKDSSKKNQCYIAYSQLSSEVSNWTILTYTPSKDIDTVKTDWSLLSILGIGLGLLFVIDLTFLLILNKSLMDTAKEADKANKAKTDFLSTMSHDIRTPMNAIVGMTTVAKKEPNNPSTTQEALKKIELASNHLLTLINDILDLSKVESGKLSINPLNFSIAETFENLVNISQPMVKSKSIDFSFRVHHFENEWLYADKLRLSQIFTNLLSNALKYTEEGGKVVVEVEEKESELVGYTRLIYKVQDTGIGMSQEYINQLYTPFSRATDSRVNAIQGTGLGLTITKQMVDLMGGTIDCQSELGVGTTFTVTIDLQIGEKPNEEMKLPPMEVLIVDDDEVLLETAVDALTSLGAQTDVATNAKDALEKINNRKHLQYKVIIVDWKMPDMSGLELAKKIQETHKKDIPIILVSAYDWSEIEKEAKDSGINGFIFKPLFRSKIYHKIMELLNTGTKVNTVDEEMDFSGMNVLVVEDNDINWEIISTLLEMNGITSVRAENGKVALNLLEDTNNDNKWDLIFMDIQMPVMNGLDATRAIRKIGRDYPKNVPIIAMTADAFSENIAECLEAGMNGHIAKPIDLNLVLAEIRKIHQKKEI